MRSYSQATRRLAHGLISISLPMLLAACPAPPQYLIRTQYQMVVWPLALSQDCPVPDPPPRLKTGEFPVESKELRKALEDCNKQLSGGRAYQDQVGRELDRINEERSKAK